MGPETGGPLLRAAWGDYDEPQTPIVTTATIGALALALDDEDF